jgi:phenylpyruvate tautomerase PptA (4-oxalocrotonate tautomerase family)
MPLTQIDMRSGKPADYKRAVMESLHAALRETFDVPEDDRFMMLTEHDENTFWFGRTYLGIERSNDLIVIQITVSNTRGIEKKKALFKCVADRLAASPGVRREDVFINLLEVAKENWSFGNGEAQYA